MKKKKKLSSRDAPVGAMTNFYWGLKKKKKLSNMMNFFFFFFFGSGGREGLY
jgi:hypothetical protein